MEVKKVYDSKGGYRIRFGSELEAIEFCLDPEGGGEPYYVEEVPCVVFGKAWECPCRLATAE